MQTQEKQIIVSAITSLTLSIATDSEDERRALIGNANSLLKGLLPIIEA